MKHADERLWLTLFSSVPTQAVPCFMARKLAALPPGWVAERGKVRGFLWETITAALPFLHTSGHNNPPRYQFPSLLCAWRINYTWNETAALVLAGLIGGTAFDSFPRLCFHGIKGFIISLGGRS